jgi:hypothetical protein
MPRTSKEMKSGTGAGTQLAERSKQAGFPCGCRPVAKGAD